MAELFEIGMLICFGISWPINLNKAIKARSTKGSSILFFFLILLGYILGIASKFLNPAYMSDLSRKWYVLLFYFFNLITVSLNIAVYFRNRQLER